MNKYEVERRTYAYEKGKWVMKARETDRDAIYSCLALRMVDKYCNKCRWITRVKEVYHYNGWHTVRMYYDNGYMDEFIVQ